MLKQLNLNFSVVDVDKKLFRDNDIPNMYGDSKASEKFGWDYNVNLYDILDEMIQFEKDNFYDQ